MDTTWTDFLSMLGTRFLLAVVYSVGIVIAAVTWRRHPRASLLSLIAFIVFLLDVLLGGVFNWLAMRSDFLESIDYDKRGIILGAGNGCFTLLNVAAWVLLLIALFGRRPAAPAWDADDPDPRRRPFAEPVAPPRRGGPPGENIQR